MSMYFITSSFFNTIIQQSFNFLNFGILTYDLKNRKEKALYYRTLFTPKGIPKLSIGIHTALANVFGDKMFNSCLQPIIDSLFKNKQENSHSQKSLLTNASPSLLSGALYGAFIQPIQYIRIKYLSSKGIIPLTGKLRYYDNVRDLINRTYIQEGPSEFYRGAKIQIFNESIGAFTYALAMQGCKGVLIKNNRPIKLWKQFILSNIAFMVSLSVVYPLDSIKFKFIADSAREERKYKNTIDCIIKTYNNGGLRGLYNNYSICAIQGITANVVNTILIRKFKNKHIK